MKKLLLLIAMLLLVSSCSKNWLVSNTFFLGNKTMKEVYMTKIQAGQVGAAIMGSNDGTGYYDYAISICDIDENGNQTQCRETIVVENVVDTNLRIQEWSE